MELLKTLCNILFSIVHVLQEIYNNRAEKRLMLAIEIFLDILQRFKHLNNKLTLTKAYSRSKHVCGYVLWLGAYFSVQYWNLTDMKRVVAPAPLYNKIDKGQVNVKKFCDAIYILVWNFLASFVHCWCQLLTILLTMALTSSLQFLSKVDFPIRRQIRGEKFLSEILICSLWELPI